jgi:hypothetical protein
MQQVSSPEQIGYAVGVVVGILFLLALVAFSIAAVIKAFTTKSTGWIIAGSIGGVVLLLFVGVFAAAFIKGFTHAMQVARENSGTAPTGPPQNITGENVAYTLKIPPGWNVRRHEKDFDVLADYRSVYVGVIAEEANLGSPEVISKLARRNLEKVARNIDMTDATPVVLDGHNWLTFTVNCDVQSIPFFYDYHVYAGPEGTIQIISWTFQNLAAKRTNQINDVIQTFGFPK